jgi:hypothetical protein
MKRLICTASVLSLLFLISCNKPAQEDKATMYANAKRMSDSIERLVDNGLNSASITPVPAAAPADTTKK